MLSKTLSDALSSQRWGAWRGLTTATLQRVMYKMETAERLARLVRERDYIKAQEAAKEFERL